MMTRLIRDGMQSLIKSVGLRVETFASARDFLAAKRPDAPACLILDVRMPGLSGLDLQRKLSDADIHIPIIFITGHGDIPMSVRAMKEGAHEFLTKPVRGQDLAGRRSESGCPRPRTPERARGTDGNSRRASIRSPRAKKKCWTWLSPAF